MKNELVACNDIDVLMSSLSITHNSEEWRLYIYSSKLSLKAVLLNVGNVLPSISVAQSVHMKESYESMDKLLSCKCYNKYQWQLCGDLKAVAILLGLQLGYIKYCCFLCFPLCYHGLATLTCIGTRNKKYSSLLIDASKVLLPQLHIKLWLI